MAGLHFRTFGTRDITFVIGTFADFTLVTLGEFNPFDPAAGAVDGLGIDKRGVELFLPLFSGGFSEVVVIVDGGDPGIANRAIEPATGDQLFHGGWVKSGEKKVKSGRYSKISFALRMALANRSISSMVL